MKKIFKLFKVRFFLFFLGVSLTFLMILTCQVTLATNLDLKVDTSNVSHEEGPVDGDEKESTLALKNIKKIFPQAPLILQNNIAENLTNDLVNQEIKIVLYQTDHQVFSYLDSTNIHELKSLLIILENDEKITKPIEKDEYNNLLFSDNLNLLIPIENLFRNNENHINYLSDFIQETSMEDLVEPFGGMTNYEEIYGEEYYSLLGAQIGEQKKIDTFQLSDTYRDIQKNSLEVARNIIQSFPELAEVEISLELLKEKAGELIFSYTYFHRWYNFQVEDVWISDIFFSNQNLFSNKEDTSNYTKLLEYIDKLKSKNLTSQGIDGMPYAYSYFLAFAPFEGTDSLRNEKKGFDRSEIAKEDGEVTMSSLLEYLIRTFTGSTNYDGWLKNQGFIISMQRLEGITRTNSAWQSLKSLENGHGTHLSSSYIPILLSVTDRSKIILSCGENSINFSNSSKLFDKTLLTPQQLADLYANRNNNMIKFIFDTGTEKQIDMLNEWLNGPVWYTFDMGEVETQWESLKDFFNPENIYINQFVLAANPRGANFMTMENVNGIAPGIGYGLRPAIYYSQNSILDEFSVAHEETHRMKSLLIEGEEMRGNAESHAVVSEPDKYEEGGLNINYYFNESDYSTWNRVPPTSELELKTYAKSQLDLIYAWNIEKARQIFSESLEVQSQKVFAASYNSEMTEYTITKLSEEELKKLAINPDQPDFLEKLIKYNIVLPADTSKESFSYFTDSGYSVIPLKKDAFFYMPYSGNGDGEKVTGILEGWTSLWLFEFMGETGMRGYADYLTANLGESDKEVILKQTGKTPEEYLLSRYQEVDKKVKSNLLKDYSYEQFQNLVSENIENDTTARSEFFQERIAATNNLFSGIYISEKDLPAPTINIITNNDRSVTGTGIPGVDISIKVDEKEVGSGKVEEDGTYNIEIPYQEIGTEVYANHVIEMEESKAVSTIVIDSGNIRIEDISDFNFGEQKQSAKEIEIMAKFSEESGIPFLKVKDTRVKNNGVGWDIQVTQIQPFKNENNKELIEATMTLSNLLLEENESEVKPSIPKKVEINNQSQSVLQGSHLVQAGEWVLYFGSEQNSVYTDGVKLKVPTSNGNAIGNYTTILEWDIVLDPSI